MIYLRLHDRLGNLMFMIGTALHLDSNVRVFCNNEQDYGYVWRMIQKLNLPITMEAPLHPVDYKFEYYIPTVFKSIPYHRGKDMLLDGYFQSYKYFCREEVLKWFKCPTEIEKRIELKWGGYLLNYQCVSLHVRRGDYLSLPERFPFVGKSYLKKAINSLNDKKTVFIVTSDDIEWCKLNIKGPNIYYSEGEDEYFDLYLASKCHHNILSNSTFSWWGAYLNQNPDKRVIVPQRWYGPVLSKEADEKNGQLIPEKWEKINCHWDDPWSYIKAYCRYWRCNWRDLIPCLKK